MYSHLTKKTIESQSCPGVSFTIRVISYARRHAIAGQVRQVIEQAGLRSVDELDKLEMLAALEVSRQMDRAYFQEMLAGVNGLEVDGRILEGALTSVDEFLESAPEALVTEIGKAIRREISLTEEEGKNSELPGGTSCGDTPGSMNAPPASATAFGAAVIAAGSTPIR